MDRPAKFKKNNPSGHVPNVNNLKRNPMDEFNALIRQMEKLKLDDSIHNRDNKPDKKMMNTQQIPYPNLSFLGNKKNEKEMKHENEKMEQDNKKMEQDNKTENEKEKIELINLINKYREDDIANNSEIIPTQDKERIRELFQKFIGKPIYDTRPYKRSLNNENNEDETFSYSKKSKKGGKKKYKKTKKGGKKKHNKTKNRK
jgi:hypothetical protein